MTVGMFRKVGLFVGGQPLLMGLPQTRSTEIGGSRVEEGREGIKLRKKKSGEVDVTESKEVYGKGVRAE